MRIFACPISRCAALFVLIVCTGTICEAKEISSEPLRNNRELVPSAQHPEWCGTDLRDLDQQVAVSATLPLSLPPEARTFAVIPGIIRPDGIDEFRIEVNGRGTLNGVFLSGVGASLSLNYPSAFPINFNDAGIPPDQTANDSVFTAGPFSFNPAYDWTIPEYWHSDPSSPAGCSFTSFGGLSLIETDGDTVSFTTAPRSIGLLRSEVPDVTALETSSPDVRLSPHVVNIRSASLAGQRELRYRDYSSQLVTNAMFEALPDVFDMIFLLTTEHMGDFSTGASRNSVAGTHVRAQTDYTGTGRPVFDNSASFGSGGRLLSVNVIDSYSRGLKSELLTHEMSHQWSAFISTSFGVSDGAHYFSSTNTASLLGGFEWVDLGDGRYLKNWGVGPGGAYEAPPLDQYMMGLIDGSQVPPLLTATASNGDTITSYSSLTIEEIQSEHGVRSPGPAGSQRSFSICFLVESREFLTPTELAFFELLASHYLKPLSFGARPYVTYTWAPATNFFGDTVSLNNDLYSVVGVPEGRQEGQRPMASIQVVPNPLRESTNILMEFVSSGDVSGRIFDVKGRLVVSLFDGWQAQGAKQVRWSGLNSAGEPVAPGKYWFVLGSGTERVVADLILIR